MPVRLKRIYDEPDAGDGRRVLVDRLWPRGVSKQRAQLDEWLRDIAPSTELRKWYSHDPARWEEFRERYQAELEENRETLDRLAEQARGQTLTLLYAARDDKHNSAEVVKRYLDGLAERDSRP